MMLILRFAPKAAGVWEPLKDTICSQCTNARCVWNEINGWEQARSYFMEVLFSADVPGDHYVSDDEDEEDPDDRYPREYIFPWQGWG